jgi:hypothetical protein
MDNDSGSPHLRAPREFTPADVETYLGEPVDWPDTFYATGLIDLCFRGR